jgi:hypothetical protein
MFEDYAKSVLDFTMGSIKGVVAVSLITMPFLFILSCIDHRFVWLGIFDLVMLILAGIFYGLLLGDIED